LSINIKFNIGSKVRIKDKKWYESMKEADGMIPSSKVCLGFNEDMAIYCGKIATITSVEKLLRWNDDKNITYYRIDLDQSGWKWVDDMFDTTHKGIEIE